MTASVQLLKAQTTSIIAGALIFNISDMGLSSNSAEFEDLFFLLDGTIGTGTVTVSFGHLLLRGTTNTNAGNTYTAFYNPAAGAVTLAALGWSAKVSQKFTAMQVVYTAGGGSSFNLYVFN